MADIISKIPDKLFSLQVKLYVNAAIFSLRISKETSNCRDNVVKTSSKGAFLNINLFSFQTEAYLYNTRSS